MNFFYQLLILAVSSYLSYALKPEPPQPRPPGLSDFKRPHTKQGLLIPKIFGTELVEDPALPWFGDLQTQAIRKQSGKK